MKYCLSLLAACALLSIGWWLRGWLHSPPPIKNAVASALPTNLTAPTDSDGSTATLVLSAGSALPEILSQLAGLDRDHREFTARSFAQRLSLAELAHWASQLDAWSESDAAPEALRSAIYRQWAKTNWPQAWAHVAKTKSCEFSNLGLDEVLAAAAHRNPSEAWNLVKQLPEQLRSAAVNSLAEEIGGMDPALTLRMTPDNEVMSEEPLQRWLRDDPEAALANLAALPPGSRRDSCLNAAASVLAKTDPAKALAWAQTLANPTETRRAFEAIFLVQGKQDPHRALQQLTTVAPTGAQHRSLLDTIISAWSESDFPAALNHSLQVLTGTDRLSALSALGTSATKESLPSLLAAASQMTIKEANAMLEGCHWDHLAEEPARLVALLAESIANPQLHQSALAQACNSMLWSNPTAAAVLFEQLDPTVRKGSVDTNYLVNSWAKKAPDEALAWMLKLPESERLRAVAGFAQGISESGCEKALAFMPQITNPKEQLAFKQAIAEQWATEDPAKALAWSKAQGRDVELHILNTLVSQNTGVDTTAALDYFQQLTAAGSNKDITPEVISNLATSIASDLATQNPQQALAWVQNLPAGDTRQSALESITSEWVRYDPEPASRWVQSLPPGPERDGAAKWLAVGIAQEDPVSALTWAFSIGNQEQQVEAIDSSLQAWKDYGNRPATALEPILEKSNFTPQQQAVLSEHLRPPSPGPAE